VFLIAGNANPYKIGFAKKMASRIVCRRIGYARCTGEAGWMWERNKYSLTGE
jgi:hypothetical protein